MKSQVGFLVLTIYLNQMQCRSVYFRILSTTAQGRFVFASLHEMDVIKAEDYLEDLINIRNDYLSQQQSLQCSVDLPRLFTPQDWDRHRSKIRDLYRTKELLEVTVIMLAEHNLIAGYVFETNVVVRYRRVLMNQQTDRLSIQLQT